MDIINKIENEIDFTSYNTLFLGFSGGADSTALLMILKKLSEKYQFKLNPVHFDHNLREESKKEAEFCIKFCEELGVKLNIYNLDVRKNITSGESTEVAARRLRFYKWEELVKEQNNGVALGHHLNDKLENLFIRLLRGSNSSGLSSLRTINKVGNIIFLRPLILFYKDSIINFLEQKGIRQWNEDKTNFQTSFRRNYIRNEILNKIFSEVPNAKEGLVAATNALEEDARYLENTAYNEYQKLKEDRALSLPVKKLRQLHNSIFVRVLRYWISEKLNKNFIPGKELIQRISYEIKNYNHKRKLVPLDDSYFIKLEYGKLGIINREPPSFQLGIWYWKNTDTFQTNFGTLKVNLKKDINKNVLEDKNYACFYIYDLPETLLIKNWEDGDKIKPFGCDYEVRVKKIFKNNKINLEDRRRIPLLCKPDGTILWIAGLLRSNYAPIDETPRKEIAVFSIQK